MAKLISTTTNESGLGEILVAENALSKEQLAQHYQAARNAEQSLEVFLVSNSILPEPTVYAALAGVYNLPFEEEPQISNLKQAPERLTRICNRERLAIKEISDKKLSLYTSEPAKIRRFAPLFGALGYDPEFIVTRPASLPQMFQEDHEAKKNQELYSGISSLASTLKSNYSEDDQQSGQPDISIESDAASVSELVNKTLLLAVNQAASDVHIETTHNGARVRFRIDGVLLDRFDLDAGSAANFISRLLIISDLDITEKIMPQDGSFKVKHGQRDIEFRIASMPGIYGQNLVLRLLSGAEKEPLSLEALGMKEKELDVINAQVKYPHGMILVAGPTGSGKSTTLYALLENMADPRLKFITIEDPVERRIAGVQQIQVRINRNEPDRSLTFAKGLRTVLRLDPDIIMVGEVRDADTAQICVQASLTGHLVLSTVHSNSSVETLRRLENIGIDFHLLMSSLNLIFSQRLVRKLCSACRKEVSPSSKELQLLKEFPCDSIFVPQGCPKCFDSGYRGRAGIFEFLPFNEGLKDEVARDGLTKSIDSVRKARLATLFSSGLEKVSQGITDFSELERVCGPCQS